MSARGARWALGLMSGTSMDGIDAALIASDGESVHETGPWATTAYPEDFRARLRGISGERGPVAEVGRELTLLHAEAVRALLAAAGLSPHEVAILGLHGHTVLHAPAERRTRQIGDGALLAREIGIDVVCDFRSADMAAGGEGAPLAPLYHAALAAGLERPLAVLNIGGVANVTWLGPSGEVIAFDTGPGNALLDDWARAHTGRPCDQDGALARAGRVDTGALARLLGHPYFERPPPKSLDRGTFAAAGLNGLSAEDGAATLAAFTAAAATRALGHLPAAPRRWLVAGGGRRNPALMAALAERLGAPAEPVEAVGWQGDALEAQAFAYLALRALEGLPLSLPTTTGVARPMPGGVLHRATAAARKAKG